MTDIFAVRPRGTSAVIHLYVHGYRPGQKARRPADVGLCNGTGGIRERELAPLADAVRWARPHQHDDGCGHPEWRWCHVCVGHAVNVRGLAGHVIELIVGGFPPPASPTMHVQWADPESSR